jgi:hypothetical protein
MADRYDEEMFLGYVEGDLPEAQREQFEALMEEDPRLRNLVAQIIHDRNALRAMPQVDPPASLRERPVEQLERGMLLGPVEPKRVSASQHRGRMFLPRLVTYGGLAAMLVLCVGLVISMLMNPGINDLGNPQATNPPDNLGPIATVPPEHVEPLKAPDRPTAIPAETTNRIVDETPSIAMVPPTDDTATTTDTTTAVASTAKVFTPMQPLSIPPNQPTIALPPRDTLAPFIGMGSTGDSGYLAKLESMPHRLDLLSPDVVATVAGLHAWMKDSQALILRPTLDLLTRTGIALQTDGQEETLPLVTPRQIAERYQTDHAPSSNHMPPMLRNGDTYVMIVAIHPDRMAHLVTYLRAQAETGKLISFSQVPNTYRAPASKLPAEQGAMQPQSLAAQAEHREGEAAAPAAASLENLVEGLVAQADQPAAANAPAAVDHVIAKADAQATSSVPATSNARKLLAIQIIAINPAPAKAAPAPIAQPPAPAPQPEAEQPKADEAAAEPAPVDIAAPVEATPADAAVSE